MYFYNFLIILRCKFPGLLVALKPRGSFFKNIQYEVVFELINYFTSVPSVVGFSDVGDLFQPC